MSPGITLSGYHQVLFTVQFNIQCCIKEFRSARRNAHVYVIHYEYRVRSRVGICQSRVIDNGAFTGALRERYYYYSDVAISHLPVKDGQPTGKRERERERERKREREKRRDGENIHARDFLEDYTRITTRVWK